MSAMACPPVHERPFEQCELGHGHPALTTLSRDGRGKLSWLGLSVTSGIVKKNKVKVCVC